MGITKETGANADQATKPVVSFGEMLIDFVPNEAGVSLAEATGFVKAPGGAPANVAVAISRLGGKSAFVGKVVTSSDVSQFICLHPKPAFVVIWNYVTFFLLYDHRFRRSYKALFSRRVQTLESIMIPKCFFILLLLTLNSSGTTSSDACWRISCGRMESTMREFFSTPTPALL